MLYTITVTIWISTTTANFVCKIGLSFIQKLLKSLSRNRRKKMPISKLSALIVTKGSGTGMLGTSTLNLNTRNVLTKVTIVKRNTMQRVKGLS